TKEINSKSKKKKIPVDPIRAISLFALTFIAICFYHIGGNDNNRKEATGETMIGASDTQQREDQRQNGLFAEERQRAILEQLRQKGKVTVEELTRTFRVSPPTIRTDLTRLEDQGLLRRTHGGAIAIGNTLYEPPYAERAVLRQAEKRAIARAAAGLVHE